MDTKWERKVLTVSAPSTPKSTPLSLPSPSLMSRLFSWNSPKREELPPKMPVKKGLDLIENISDMNLNTLMPGSNDTLTELVSEFDPVPKDSKDDWMLTFDSPQKEVSTLVKTPVKSLIDDLMPIASPNSIVKYTQKDLENLKLQLEAKFTKEFEVAQLEIQEMESHRKLYMDLNKELEGKLQSFINFESSESENKSLKIESLERELEKITLERDSYKREQELLEIKCRKTSLELEEARGESKKILESLESNLEKMKGLETRYETLKQHAQSKLDEANIEIAKTRSNYEKEISTYKTKLQRCELTISSLERSLAVKEEENKELTVICDGLVQQMENN